MEASDWSDCCISAVGGSCCKSSSGCTTEVGVEYNSSDEGATTT